MKGSACHTWPDQSLCCSRHERMCTLAPLISMCGADKEPVSHSKAPASKGPVSAPASRAQRAKSGSPPPWAHLVGQNAVFRPALGNREHTPPVPSGPPSRPSAAPASKATASDKDPSGQHEKATPSNVSQVRKSSPELTQATLQKPGKGNGASAASRKGTPEPRIQSQQAPKHAADSSRKAQPRQQQIPQHLNVRSQTGTPEPPSQAPKQLAGQSVPPPKQSGKPPLRPSPGSSRDPTPDIAGPASRGGTPDSVNVSSSSGRSNPNTSRDATPQPGTSGQPLSRPSPLSRPGSTPPLPGRPLYSQQLLWTSACLLAYVGSDRFMIRWPRLMPFEQSMISTVLLKGCRRTRCLHWGWAHRVLCIAGAATQAGTGAPVKAVKKPRKLLGKKGAAAKRKAGQGAEEAREMKIPAAGLVGARKGLIYCLVGLISHRRYSSKVLHPCLAVSSCALTFCLASILPHRCWSCCDACISTFVSCLSRTQSRTQSFVTSFLPQNLDHCGHYIMSMVI